MRIHIESIKEGLTIYTDFCPIEVDVSSKMEAFTSIRIRLRDKIHRVLVAVPHELVKSLSLSSLLVMLRAEGHTVHLMIDIPANPTVSALYTQLASLRKKKYFPTTIIAIGGGSCMDLAKGISALLLLQGTTSIEGVRASIVEKTYLQEHPFIDLIHMPTTSGTGSEVTTWATIWDVENQKKLSIECDSCRAKAALLIPEWTISMPASLTLSTGLDALCHAMEAFWSVQSTDNVKQYSLGAIRKIHEYLPKVLQNPNDVKLRKGMLLGSLLSGIAFSHTHTTACHSISYPLTMLFHIPHGYAAALTLVSVMRRNEKVMPEIESINALFEPDNGLSAWLASTCEDIQVLKLNAFGITQGDLQAIVTHTFTQGRMDNNPICFGKDDVTEILCECL